MHPEKLGPYVIDSCLGQGGMGTVYAGTSEETGLSAAVKVLSPTLASSQNFRDRFEIEIETLKKLHHPHIVELFGYGEQQGQLFYAMELVDGKSLQQMLQDGRMLSWQETLQLAIQVTGALKHAHDRGVIHRDLKPANLLITDDGTVKLSDFGIAKLFGAHQMTAEGGVIGTAHYMAPEQADGQPATARSDFYSLGCVMFAALTRRPPFVGKSIAEVVHAVRLDPPPLLQRLAPDVPEEIEQIILDLLQKDPSKRVATALQLSNRLKATEIGLTSKTENLADHEETSADGQASRDPTVVASPSEVHRLSQHSKDTVDAGELDDSRYELQLSEDADPARSTHYTMVDEREQKRVEASVFSHSSDDSMPAWVTILLVVAAVAVLGGAVWLGLRPASADRLYDTVTDAQQEERLESVADDIKEFIERFPEDKRIVEVQEMQEVLDAEQLRRNLERRAKGLLLTKKLEPAEAVYLGITRLIPANPDLALKKIDAFIVAFDDPTSSKQTAVCVRLAKLQRERLEKTVNERYLQNQVAIRAKLSQIEQLVSENPVRAKALCQAMITLYEDEPWAETFVEEARKQFELLE